ncbi:alpha/beta hydrolase [Marinobacter sp. NP-6]|uniref:alpha/beta fold hydrolase n=1 Tax=Marinobacter sp. NP-6 TaxID=2488666 RepID=UPI000FCC96C9|nr:alpha/beta hydrolase [Marinobacter sp. NP-6]RUT76974.1 alpha/beta hydrolase [Marinobacter sp. NP-6]
MSLWLDMLGAEIRFVTTPNYGEIRIAEAGKGNSDIIVFQHGINGHLEAYAKNIMALSEDFHVIAFDYVGHGLSSKKEMDYSPIVLAEQMKELLDVLGHKKVHLSGESLGGWTSAHFAAKYPERVDRLMLNTAAGLPIVTEKGKKDLENLIELNKRNINNVPNYESVEARMHWLMHESNHHLINDELVNLRLGIYLKPETMKIAPRITEIVQKHDDYLIPLESIKCDTLFLWTEDNPIHDIETARSASKKIPGSQVYLMKAKSAHWPQYEAPDEFNQVTRNFFKHGKVE